MAPEPFLSKIAKAYIQNEPDLLVDTCFVFPNRRSSSFFKKYFCEQVKGKAFVLPEIRTISEFVSGISGLLEVDRVEQLMILYAEFRKLSQEFSDFDKFLYWGDMILGDFNDVDRYMVDARALFHNMANFKEIQSNYLTEAQLDVIKEFWGLVRSTDDEHLWVRPESKSAAKGAFTRLWDVLADLYENFRAELEKKGVAYNGMMYRATAENIEKKTADDFEFRRIVFVGFSTLSTAEEKIFRHLHKLDIADFYWDFESPFFDDVNKGSFFLRKYVKAYPSRYTVTGEATHFPNVEVVSVPSGGGQAKVVNEILGELQDAGKIDMSDPIDTAVVMPEEKYLNSVLSAISGRDMDVNITMGFPIGQTSVASLVSMVSTLHHRRRLVGGSAAFYFPDVESLLTHPYMQLLARSGSEIDRLLDTAKEKRLFFVPASFFSDASEGLRETFCSIDSSHSASVIDYLDRLLGRIETRLSALHPTEAQEDDAGEASLQETLELYFIRQYRSTLAVLRSLITTYNVEGLSGNSSFFLLSRMMAGSSVPFEGEPLKGLQLMGVLETRLLDFKNLIILSMNEKVFPTKHYTRSFIPNTLRIAFGMATYELQDSMYTYYFYRMISRAENVYLIYDSRTQGLSSGEESRYIYQLEKIYYSGADRRDAIRRRVYDYKVEAMEEVPIVVNKDDRVMAELEKFKTGKWENGKWCGARNLSASAIKAYIACPLKFYLNRIENIKEAAEMSDFIDSATFGLVVHRVFELVYNGVSLKNEEGIRLVTADYIDGLLESKHTKLDQYVTSAVNCFYNGIEEEDRRLTPLEGEAILIGKIVAYYVEEVLRREKDLCPFDYLGSEVEDTFPWKLYNGIEFNFKMFIDRLDRVSPKPTDEYGEKRLRIVDYKTGDEEMELKNDYISTLFGRTNAKWPEGIFQLLLYCNAYEMRHPEEKVIQPVIYKLRKVTTWANGRQALTVNKANLFNYKDAGVFDNQAFMDEFGKVIESLFDPKEPFRQTENEENCKYCQFKEACGR